jgi:hypothetical protein
VRIGSPRPNVGEGLGVRGVPLCRINPRNLALVGVAKHSREHPAALAPSPLTPLPRWGEGDRTLSGFSSHEDCCHYIV